MTRPEALATLGLTGRPSKQAVKEAYRLLAQAWHPDRHASDPRATERFQRFTEAQEILLGVREATEPQGAEPGDEGKRRKLERVRRVAKMAASRTAKRTLVDLLGEPAAGALQGFAAALLGGLGGGEEAEPPPRRRRRRPAS